VWGLKHNDFVLFSNIMNQQQGGMITNFFELSSGYTKEMITLCSGAQKVLNTPNAGGNSIWSETISFEVLASLCRAVLHKTEMEIEYMPGSKITDYSVKVFDKDIGVSVTRAMKFSKKGELFTEEDAMKLLSKKLHGVNESTKGVVSQTWEKQILHIWTQQEYMSDILWNTYEKMSEEIKSNTLVVTTVCKNAEWLFRN
jgi:hypothetical protein